MKNCKLLVLGLLACFTLVACDGGWNPFKKNGVITSGEPKEMLKEGRKNYEKTVENAYEKLDKAYKKYHGKNDWKVVDALVDFSEAMGMASVDLNETVKRAECKAKGVTYMPDNIIKMEKKLEDANSEKIDKWDDLYDSHRESMDDFNEKMDDKYDELMHDVMEVCNTLNYMGL